MRILSADIAPLPLPHISPEELRGAAGCFATGVTIISSGSGQDFHATTVNAFASLSLDPPLMLVSLSKSSRLALTIEESGDFVINILSAKQLTLAQTCALKKKDLRSLEIARTEQGVTHFKENLSTIICDLETRFEGGDHFIFVGRVRQIILGPKNDPLLFFRGRYETIQTSRKQ